MVVIRQWRHIKMLKRGGRAHDPSGVGGTSQGELAVKCRSCPQPGINIPPNWKECPPQDRWLYSLIVAQDANFKQKARIRVNDNQDTPLGPGWATFVNDGDYQEHIRNHSSQDEVNDIAAENIPALLISLTD